MTNHWDDIDNASMVFVYGANPAENHPACMAHINAARFGSKSAQLIVVDPRKTRTALQADMYVRIRPGTNVAFTNGLMKWIFDNIGTYSATAASRMLAYHNSTDANFGSAARTFADDGGVTRTLSGAELLGAKYGGVASNGFTTLSGPTAATYPKYADTRFLVNAAGDDYQRAVLTTVSNTGTAAWQFTDFPVVAQTVDAQVGGLDTVWTWLKAHLAPYTTATVADICGCTEAEIVAVAQAIVDNSRFKSNDWNAAQATPQNSAYKATTVLYAMGQTQHTNGSQNIKDLAVIQTLMGNMGRAGGGINALRGIHNVQGSTDMGLLYDSIPAYGSNPAVAETFSHYINGQFGNRTTGNTAALAASVTIRGTAANSGIVYTAKVGGTGGNSIRIQYLDPGAPSQALSVSVSGTDVTVNLATDAGGLITSTAALIIPAIGAYTPTGDMPVTAGYAVTAPANNGSGVVTAKAWVTLSGGTAALAELSTVAGKLGLQQRGFYNMTTEWFGNGTSSGADVALLYNLWPKGNGIQHIQTFRYMAAGTVAANLIKAAVVWGQNPAVTEPNQSAVRIGLKNLELMVVVDMFETETAACDRKDGAPTYLIPTCAHVEESGSVTNSGRWLQWRERACAPKGNSRSDLELLLRFAYSLDKAGAFTHFTDIPYNDDGTGVPSTGVWSTLGTKINGPAYKVLYGNKLGWTPTDATAFEAKTAAAGAIERWAPGATAPQANFVAVGSEVFTEAVFKEMCRPLNYSTTTGGTMWIYSGSDTGASGIGEGATPGASAWNDGASYATNYMPIVTSSGNTVAWQTKNRAKSRYNVIKGNDTNGANNYPRWGWAWLLNRRVFYNNGEVAGDQADNFVGPGLVALLYTSKTPAPSESGLADWSLVYRKYKTFADAPSVAVGPHFVSAGKTFMGRFPGHTEPTESPRPDLVTTWGHNMSGVSPLYWTGANPTVPGSVVDYPLVLTSIRCVEHFQGGPITRNNTWNVEAEPVPWIEINVTDARNAVPPINDGDWVNVITARSDSTTDQTNRTVKFADHPEIGATTGWARGFKARVGVGLQANQRVGVGVVAIPWHWGDKGLSTGSRANDLCIDAWDANSQIPEYKACLCRIVKL